MKLKLADNLFLKVLSVVLAIVLWLVVVNISDAQDTERYSVEVALVNTDVITGNGKVFRVEEGTNIVKLTVRARQSVLSELKPTDFVLTADMQKDLKYDSLVGITVECKNRNINVDEDITLSRSNVEVSIEDAATEQFQVLVKKTGTENDGLVVGSMVPEQTIIKISGPVSIVERIKTVEAQVDVTGLPATAVKNCELKLYDSVGGLIDSTYLNYIGKTNGINVTVSMLNTKTVPLKFSYTGTPAKDYEIKEISYKPEIIEIAGNADVLSGISRLEIPKEAINVDGIEEELQLVIDLTQYLPSGVILKDQDEASVLVIVEVQHINEEDEGTGDDETSKPSTPSDEEESKPSDGETSKDDTTVDKEDSGNQNNPSNGTEDSGSSSSKDDTSVEGNN